MISLLSNLISHKVAIHNSEKIIEDIDIKNPNIFQNIDKRNRNTNILNWISLSSIIFGTIFLSFFLIFNIYNMNENKSNSQGKPTTTKGEPKPLNEEKGKTSTKPSFQINPKKK